MNSLNNKGYSKSESNINVKISHRTTIKKNSLKYQYKNPANLNRNMFDFLFIIGKGGFGKVWRVQEKKTKELYALKEMSKTKIIDKKSEKSINGEREFLSYLHHPFIVNMHYAFQDHNNLYLVMDLLTGGDLRYHCSRYRSFSEEQTRFFLACIIHSLSYIHKNKVIHRDIKPENLVLDDKGYVHITDFGIAKINLPDNSSETSGTPGYMCPEVMYGKNHSFPADYFSIGVIGYEFMMGKRPYHGRGRKEIKEQMINIQAKIEKKEIKNGWSLECVDFINKLLMRKVKQRLGSTNGIKELKKHPWMKYYPWKELSEKKLPAPFIPERIDNFDKKYCESIDEISDETQLRYDEIVLKTHFNTAFIDFYFDKNEKKESKNENEEKFENNEEEEEDENDNDKDETKSTKKNEEENTAKKETFYNKKKSEIIVHKNYSNSMIKKEPDIVRGNEDSTINKNNNNNNEDNYFDSNKKQNQNLNNDYFINQGLNKINAIKIKRSNKIDNQFKFHKNNSDINLINNRNRNNNSNNINLISKDKIIGKKTLDNFINIKKIYSKPNKFSNIISNSKDKEKEKVKEKIDNCLMSLCKLNNHHNNTLRIKKPINNNILNKNNSDLAKRVNNSNRNINIFLSINMFNKMLNNHIIKKNKHVSKEKNSFPELANHRKQLINLDGKKLSLNNIYSKNRNSNQNSLNKINNQNNNNKLIKSNSVGLYINNNYRFVNQKYNYLNKNMSSNKNNYNNNSFNKK